MPSQKIPLKNSENPMNSAVRDVLPQEVFDKANMLHLVDVRNSDELLGEHGKATGIVHIPLDEMGGRFHELPKDKTIVFICRSGSRSAVAAAFAQDEGLDAYNMAGGMILWNDLGLPLERKS